MQRGVQEDHGGRSWKLIPGTHFGSNPKYTRWLLQVVLELRCLRTKAQARKICRLNPACPDAAARVEGNSSCCTAVTTSGTAGPLHTKTRGSHGPFTADMNSEHSVPQVRTLRHSDMYVTQRQDENR